MFSKKKEKEKEKQMGNEIRDSGTSKALCKYRGLASFLGQWFVDHYQSHVSRRGKETEEKQKSGCYLKGNGLTTFSYTMLRTV